VTEARTNQIRVFAGVNGAGKSSVLGEAFARAGGSFFDPDRVTRELLAANPSMSLDAANSEAWTMGRSRLERAIAERRDFAFETTLGGTSITALLERAAALGQDVEMAYVGLDSVERHIARVRARVAAGGHDIPEPRIRERYHTSRHNVVRLLPSLNRLRVWDNSAEADPKSGARPRPLLILETARGRAPTHAPLDQVPDWAKPIVAAALRTAAATPASAPPRRRPPRAAR